MTGWHGLLEIVATPLGPAGLAALVLTIYLYANLSRRLGAVTKMPPYYRWFVAGGGLTGMAVGVFILRSAAYLSCREEAAFLTSPEIGLIFFHLPLLIGTIINVATALRYWSWLLAHQG